MVMVKVMVMDRIMGMVMGRVRVRGRIKINIMGKIMGRIKIKVVMNKKSIDVLPESFLKCMSAEDRKSMGRAGVTKPEAEAKGQRRDECALQRLIATFLNREESNGVLTYFWQSTHKKATGRKGTPDFIFCYRGRFCAAEVKYGEGRLRTEQVKVLRKIQECGGAANVVRSLEDVRELIAVVDKLLEGS